MYETFHLTMPCPNRLGIYRIDRRPATWTRSANPDFERVGPTLLTPNEIVMWPGGSVELGQQSTDPEGPLLGFVRTVEKVAAACTTRPTKRINPAPSTGQGDNP